MDLDASARGDDSLAFELASAGDGDGRGFGGMATDKVTVGRKP